MVFPEFGIVDLIISVIRAPFDVLGHFRFYIGEIPMTLLDVLAVFSVTGVFVSVFLHGSDWRLR